MALVVRASTQPDAEPYPLSVPGIERQPLDLTYGTNASAKAMWQSNAPRSPGRLWCCITFGLFAATCAGVVLIPISLLREDLLASRQPAASFVQIPGGCTVLSVMHVGCSGGSDEYSYLFTTTSTATPRWKPKWRPYAGANEQRPREDGARCSDPDTLHQASSYSLFQNVSCWEPARGASPALLASAYTCGNAECILLFDPSLEHTRQLEHARYLTRIGAAVAGAALPLFILSTCKLNRLWPSVLSPPPSRKVYYEYDEQGRFEWRPEDAGRSRVSEAELRTSRVPEDKQEEARTQAAEEEGGPS